MKAKTEILTENGFKETDIGLIPSDWGIKKISDIAEIKYGKQRPREKGLIPVIGSSGTYAFCKKELVNFPTLIIGRKGNAGSVQLLLLPCWPADTTFYMNWKSKNVDDKFLYYYMSLKPLSGEHAKTTMPSLQRQDLEEYQFPSLSFNEQQKIASVLSKIQQAIEQQDKIIQTTKELKKSLMNKLFAEGLHGEGQKETEIGLIPKSWSITLAEKFCERVTDGTHESPKPAESGYYLVTSKNLKDGKIIFDGCYLISEENYKSVNERSKVDLYDVVFGMIGTIGSPVIIRREPDFAIKNVGLFKTDKNKELGLWLFYYLSSDSVERLVDKQKAGATQKYIPLWFLRQLPVPIPSEKERNEITKILEDISLKLDAEENRLIILKNLFKTMLNQLMTGRVRVKNLDIEVN